MLYLCKALPVADG